MVGDPKFVHPDISPATRYGVDADWHLQAHSKRRRRRMTTV
jgi:hypothetical protein